MATTTLDFFTAEQIANSTSREFYSAPIFYQFDGTWCRNPADMSDSIYSFAELEELVVDGKTGDVCLDYCVQVDCDSYSDGIYRSGVTNGETWSEALCVFSVVDPSTYIVTTDRVPNMKCYVRGPSVDCSPTSNCTPQFNVCGGWLPYTNFGDGDLLSCVWFATSFEFDSKIFVRKAHTTTDFFYNEAEKTFMKG